MSKCHPEWSKKNIPCPYGKSLILDVTKQKIPTIFNRVSIIGSYVVIISIVILHYQIWNSTLKKKHKYIINSTLPIIVILNELIIKRLFKHKRPVGSCNKSCGFPSSHAVISSYISGLSLVLTKYSKSEERKTSYILFSTTTILWLITIISRVGVKDHSFNQVIAGSIEGFLFSFITYIILENKNIL